MRRIIAFIAVLIVIALIAAPSLALGGFTELSYNGDFDEIDLDGGLPVGWEKEGWYTESTDAEITIDAFDDGGGNCVHIWNFVENDTRLCQTISVEGNSFYELSCDVLVGSIQGGAGANISVAGTLAISEPAVADGSWHRLKLVGKTAKDQTQLRVAVRVGGYGSLSEGDAWFDSISVKKLNGVPALATDFSIASSQGSEEKGINFSAIALCAVLCALAFVTVYYKSVIYAPTPCDLSDGEQKRARRRDIVILAAAAFVLRLLLSLIFVGHSTDIGCFLGWSNAMVEFSPAGFYTSGMFADYPPGYMYILWLLGGISKLLGFDAGLPWQVMLIKLPAVLADIVLALMAYRLAEPKLGHIKALLIAGVIAFNPAVAFISGGWGQVDSLLALALVGAMYCYGKDKKILAGAVYGLAILLKPQALMLGPLFAAAYIYDIFGKGWKKRLIETVLAVLSAVAVILLLALPFWGQQDADWLLKKYFSTATSYPYASIEAFNLAGLFGGNWVSVEDTMLIFSYKAWGTVLMALTLIWTGVLYIKGRIRDGETLPKLMLCAGFTITALYTVGYFMHERYLFIGVIFLLFAFAMLRDRRLFISAAILCTTLFANILCAFYITDDQEARGAVYDAVTAVFSFIEVVGFAYLAWCASDILLGGGVREAFNLSRDEDESRGESAPLPAIEEEYSPKLRYSKKDRLCCIGLTAIYAVVALLNLGTTVAPESYWRNADIGGVVNIELESSDVASIRIFGGMATGSMLLMGDDGFSFSHQQTLDDMFTWKDIGGFTTDKLTLEPTGGALWINEIAFFDSNGEQIGARAWSDTDPEAAKLTDEQDEVPAKPSYLNGMYFDELYHARTAYEHLNGLQPYENSHPPLGKVLIMLGIAVFGMNAFGWRIVGTLFGIGMVPIMYAFAKRLFKKTQYALLASALFAFDFMHFSQTRIATIDVYAVFFIILMYYYMYQYYCMSFVKHGLRATLKPLALAGLFFALGAASKWICIYAGAGLAVLLALSLIRRYDEARVAHGGQARREYWKNVIKTLLWCCVFYIVVPVAVYLLSYIPYYLCETHYDLAGVWKVQEFMFTYHSGLKSTHPFQSSWWEWPLMLRPIWYYWRVDSAAQTGMSISALGNPAVWWVCTLGTVALGALLLTRSVRREKGMTVLLTGVAANYLPWVLVSRCTFIYHFFATVPFIVLCTVYVAKYVDERYPKYKFIKWVWLGLAVLLFILFYPALSGMSVSLDYLDSLQWLRSWNFMIYQ